MDLRSKDAIESSKQHDIDMDNILIAEFMGAEKTHIKSVGDIYCPVPSKNGSEYADKLQYHKSWDWLIPVIEKIQDKYLENPELDEWDLDEIRLAVPNIQEVHYLIVEFIKENNQNN